MRRFLFSLLINSILTDIHTSALANAGDFLQPFADIIAKKFGAAVSILMVCPIGSKNGEIELRR